MTGVGKVLAPYFHLRCKTLSPPSGAGPQKLKGDGQSWSHVDSEALYLMNASHARAVQETCFPRAVLRNRNCLSESSCFDNQIFESERQGISMHLM